MSKIGVWEGTVWLTDTEIKRSKSADEPYKLSDSGGLYMMVTPAGGKLWRWKYCFDGKEKLMTQGKYPETSLALGRERHAEGRKLLALGTDPMAKRKEDKVADGSAAANSFASISDLWLEHWSVGKNPRHVDSVRRRLAADILPQLGSRPISEIDAPELVAMTKAIEKRGAHDIAKRALETTCHLAVRHRSRIWKAEPSQRDSSERHSQERPQDQLRSN